MPLYPEPQHFQKPDVGMNVVTVNHTRTPAGQRMHMLILYLVKKNAIIF